MSTVNNSFNNDKVKEEPEQSIPRKIWLIVRLIIGVAIIIAGIVVGIWMFFDDLTGINFSHRGGFVLFAVLGFVLGSAVIGNERIKRRKR